MYKTVLAFWIHPKDLEVQTFSFCCGVIVTAPKAREKLVVYLVIRQLVYF